MSAAADSIAEGFAREVPAPIRAFLGTASSPDWAEALAADLETLLIDHANCELKAAASALALMHRYPERTTLIYRMSRLAREELRHYEQVQHCMDEHGIAMRQLSASGYAAGLKAVALRDEPLRLVDTLIIGALIEARSCERFALIAPLLPESLARFYRGLLASEARHFEHYLELAHEAADGDASVVTARLAVLREREQALIATPADTLRFHSGPPANC
ncbi:MAG: tRNA isopentenyl-2-thiomethyl-A-37 hydroxylase MiaE [Pseudomonadota bacterium]